MINVNVSIELAITIVGGLILTLLVGLCAKVLNHFRQKQNWFTPEFDVAKGKFFYIVTSSIEVKRPDGSTSKKGEIGDSRALIELVSNHHFPCHSYTIDSIEQRLKDNDNVTHENIISIGGESGNPLTRMLLDRCECPFRFQGYSLADTLTGEKYFAVLDAEQENRVNKDYAIIVKSPNPKNEENKIYIIAGIHSDGTFGAARCSHKDYEKIINKLTKGKSIFAILIEVKFDYLKDEPEFDPQSIVRAYYSKRIAHPSWQEIKVHL